MAVDTRSQLGLFLEQLAQSLDISDAYFDLAEQRYKAVGTWLGEKGSELVDYKPEIYTQGSFRLGTVTKPVSDKDDYDIDLVCCLSIPKEDLTQRSLKTGVGNRIKAHGTYGGMLDHEEGRRSWRLNYAPSAKFHMDVLPSLPDDEGFVTQLCSHGVPLPRARQALAITDNQHEAYDRISSNWPRSNPGGYSDWFKEQMIVRFDEQRLRIAKSIQASVEDVPEHRVKTPLQQVVQILKRHRDLMFLNDPDDEPISIIITTLAAQAYSNESDLLNALINIVDGMAGHILTWNGRSWVPNPVNPHENFADKWQEHPQREVKFRKWLLQIREDFSNALDKRGIVEMAESLQPRFGEGMIKKSLSQFSSGSSAGSSMVAAAPSYSLSRFNVPHRQPLRWPLVENGWVQVTGWASRDGYRPWQISSDSAALQKHCSLRFEARTNISRPFKVYWQVVNTGVEARDVDCLRGGFYDGVFEKGGLVRNEGTRYQGSHWVECFIVKDGACVARSGEFVVNIA